MHSIKHEFHVITTIGYGIILLGFCLLGILQKWTTAVQWILQTGLLWGLVCHYTRARLDLNKANAAAPLFSSLGWGNRLTILRGGLIAITGGFLFLNSTEYLNTLIPAISYTTAAILDRLDGYAARRSKQVSLLGNYLDINFDALGLVIAPLLAISLGKIHWSYLFLSVAYYAYQWGLQRRANQGLIIHDVPANPLRRTLAGFQMAFIALALWPILNPALTKIASVAFMLPVLFGFAVDWLVVCGRLAARTINKLSDWSENFFQPVLRVLLAMLLVLMLKELQQLPVAISWLFWVSIGLTLLGFAARVGSVLVMLLLGWHYPAATIDLTDTALIVTISWIMLLGAGRFSLWQWDDAWVARYDGA